MNGPASGSLPQQDIKRPTTFKQIDYSALPEEEYLKRKRIEQVKVYLITYIAYALIHFERVFWSLSKSYLKTGPYKDKFTTVILSDFDFAELIAYSIFLYLSGIIGDNFDQRKVLTWAYIGLGTVFFMLGIPGFMDLSHAYWRYYFIVVMVLIGALNAMLWPSFISILGHWFPKSSRGFLAGLWSTCNNTGNIIGIEIGAFLMTYFGDSWQWLLVSISVLIYIWAGVIFFYLVPEPDLIGIKIYDKISIDSEHNKDGEHIDQGQSISFWEAFKLPRVALYASCFFCTKMAVYCLLLWLPTFLKGDPKLAYTNHQVANLQSSVDLGAVFGSVALGYISDLLKGQRIPVALFAVISATLISYFVTFHIYSLSSGMLLAAMFGVGFFINSLNNLISSVCAADLGKQKGVQSRAISTVTGIIDGTGSLGSALGQLLVGQTSGIWGWQWGYLFVVSLDINMTAIPVLIIIILDYQLRNRERNIDANQDEAQHQMIDMQVYKRGNQIE